MNKLQLGIKVTIVKGVAKFKVTINRQPSGRAWSTYRAANNYRLSWFNTLSPEAELDNELLS